MDQALVIPQASVVGLCGKLSRFQLDEIKGFVFLGGFGKAGVNVHAVSTKVRSEHICAKVPLLIFAKKLNAKVTQANLFDNGKPVTHAIPQLQNVHR